MTITVINGPTIARYAALSDAIDCTIGALIRLTMPSGWDRAVLTFQLSPDNVAAFGPVCGKDGKEISVTVTPNAVVLGLVFAGGWIKLQSGLFASPVPQQQTRTFRCTLDTTIQHPA